METDQIRPHHDTVMRPLREADLADADRIMRLAFGTFVGMPQPENFMEDANYVRTRAGRHEAYRVMLGKGFRTVTQGLAMQRGNQAGYNHPGVYVVDDWR